MTYPTFGSAALRLLANGYEPIPVLQGQKRPAIEGWSSMDLDESTVGRYARNGMANAAIGLRGGRLCVLDLDIDHPDLAEAMRQWAHEHIGPGLVRLSTGSRLALFYQADADLADQGKLLSAAYDGARIEARLAGTQTVIFGRHPKGLKYRWQGPSPLDTPLHRLPTVTRSQIQELFTAFEDAATAAGLDQTEASATGAAADAGEWMKPKYQISDADLLAALRHLPADDYHQWVKVGMALYHHFDGSDTGLAMWDAWSRTAPEKYDPDACERKWSTFHEVGRRSTVTVGSIIKQAQDAGWQNPGPPATPVDVSEAAEAVDHVSPPESRSEPPLVARMLDTTPPPIQWLVPGLMPAGKVCLLVAPGGTGKSLLTLQLGYSVATGARFLGRFDVPETGNVLVLGAEDDNDDLHRRIHAIHHSFIEDFPDPSGAIARRVEKWRQAAIARFHPVSLVGRSVQLLQRDGLGHTMTPLTEKIIAKARALDARLIILDPLSRFGCGEEGPDMVRLVETLEHIRNATGATILAVHHANKAAMREGGADMQYASRGHSALTDGVRFQANLAALHPDDAEQHGIKPDEAGLYVKLAVSKTNYTAPQEGVWLRRGEGGVLTAIDIDYNKREQDAMADNELRRRIMTTIRRLQANGEPISQRAFVREYAGREGPLGASRSRVLAQVEYMLDQGYIALQERKGKGGGHVLVTGPEADSMEQDSGDGKDDLLDI